MPRMRLRAALRNWTGFHKREDQLTIILSLVIDSDRGCGGQRILLISRYFPNARGSGIPQTKFALFIRDGYASFRTVAGKFLCCSISLASEAWDTTMSTAF